MSWTEPEALFAHEVSHVANGDMVTLALIQGGGQHLCHLPVTGRGTSGRSAGVQGRARARAASERIAALQASTLSTAFGAQLDNAT